MEETKKESGEEKDEGKQNKDQAKQNKESNKGYFDTELKTSLLFSVIGAIVGYLSFITNYTSVAAVYSVIIFIALYYVAKKIFKISEEKKWWSTMAILYFLIWIVVWTVLYNYALY